MKQTKSTKMATMKIGTGVRTGRNNTQMIMMGYASRVGTSLVALLKENGAVEMIAIGPEATNNMTKGIAYGQRLLEAENQNLVADHFEIREISVNRRKGTSNKSHAVCIRVRLL